MKKRHLLLLLCLLLAVPLCVYADPVDVEAARQKAAEFLQGQKAKGARRRAPAVRQLTMAAAGPEGSYYIFNAKDNQGYVVVSGDDATEEILGYSNTGAIDTTFMPCGLRMLLDSYADQIKFLRDNGITREQNSPSKARKASDLPASYIISEVRRSKFDQDTPYNNLCHMIGGKPAVTGCVATAMAGLMFAYKWPKHTISEIPGYHYWTSPFNRESVEGVPAHTAIDWDHIEPQYTYYTVVDGKYQLNFLDTQPIQNEAVATLMQLAGISVKMEYEKKESSAKIRDIPKALKEYFAYDENIIYAKKDENSRETWLTGLREEIINSGPVLYGGQRTDDEGKDHRHAFLLEGFEGDYFTINFGWSGLSDDNYRLDVFEGNDKLIRYPDDQCALFYVQPIPHVEMEVTQLRIDSGSVEDGTFTDTTLRGNITIHNKGKASSVKIIYLKLTDVESGEVTPRVIITYLSPDDSDTFRFAFINLTIGHHYVLSALDFFEDEFYRSPELLCIENPTFSENDETAGNETLTRFEYWFDDDFAARRTKTLSSKKAVLRGNVNTDQLSVGLHYLHFRVQRDDGSWSGISSSPFMKLDRSTEARLDYWIDDDYENRVSLPIAENEDEQLLTFDLSECSVGIHKLNYQVTLPGLLPGAVEKTTVMKLPSGVAPQLEYWFDDDLAHSQTLDGRSSSEGDDYIYVNTIDMSNLSKGVHRLNFRATGSSNQKRSSVMSCSVMKFPLGTGNRLQYWYDDDKEHAVVFDDGVSEDDCFIYEKQLNMSSLSAGVHRLNFRAISSGGQKRSALMTSYVMKLPLGKGNRLQYWYDDDKENAVILDNGVSEDDCFVYESQLNMSSLSTGVHRLNFRAISSGGQRRSPLMTAYVMKYPLGKGNRLQYWYDDDKAHAVTLEGVSENDCFVYEKQLNMSDLSVGVHLLNFRAISTGGQRRSPLMTSYVMKMPLGKGNRLEYWYDDDDENAVVLDGMSEDDCLVYESQLNMSSLSVGLHRLSFRAVSNDGQLKSPLMTCYVMRNVTGSVSRLEYWFDDDRDNIYTMSGHAAEAGAKGYIFAGELDISKLSPGHHRLHYRGIGNDRQLSTATGTASILVKLDVNGNATMASYSISVDGEFIAQGPLEAKAEVDFSYILDAKNLSKGIHILQTTFWNNFGSSVSEDTAFEVTIGDDDAVMEVEALPVSIHTQGGIITILGAAEGTLIAIYGVDGKMYGSAVAEKDSTIIATSLRPGSIAIVKIGEKAVKVLIK